MFVSLCIPCNLLHNRGIAYEISDKIIKVRVYFGISGQNYWLEASLGQVLLVWLEAGCMFWLFPLLIKGSVSVSLFSLHCWWQILQSVNYILSKYVGQYYKGKYRARNCKRESIARRVAMTLQQISRLYNKLVGGTSEVKASSYRCSWRSRGKRENTNYNKEPLFKGKSPRSEQTYGSLHISHGILQN